MKLHTIIISGLVAFLAPVSISAQALPFTGAQYDAASLGKGGASLVQTSSTSGTAFSNVAAVPFSDQDADMGIGYAMWAPDGVSSNIISIGGSYNMKQKLGVAAGISYGMNPAYDIIDGTGTVTGQFKPSDIQLSAGVSYRFLPFLSIGANVGYATSKLSVDASYGSLVADVFLMSKSGGFKVAAGVSELGTGVTSASGAKFAIPTAASIGLGYDASFGKKNSIELLADADYYFKGGIAAALGACYCYNKLISIRAGYRYGGESILPSFISLGAGVHYAGIKLDLAYLIGDGVGNTLAFTIGYTIGSR